MDHFESIGFRSANLKNYLSKAAMAGNRHKTPSGEYSAIQDTSGATFIAGFRKEGIFRRLKVVGANPHFQGTNRNKVFLHSLKVDKAHLEAEAFAWMGPSPGILKDCYKDFLANAEYGKFPFTFNLAFSDRYVIKPLPILTEVNLVCFPQNFFSIVKAEQDIEIFWENIKRKPIELADKAFLPVSNFKGGTPCVSFISGIITDVKTLRNSETDINFYVCRVESFECELEIVFSDTQANHKPEVSNRIIGQFWVTGEIQG